MKKKRYNPTSILGLITEITAMTIMAFYYFQGKPIPNYSVYLFYGGFLIIIAGTVIGIRNNRK